MKRGSPNRWAFPKGKLYKDEVGLDCAIRGVKEEVNFNISLIAKSNQFWENKIQGHQVSVTLKYFPQIIAQRGVTVTWGDCNNRPQTRDTQTRPISFLN